MKILGTGLSGLVGSKVSEFFRKKHNVENISLETGVDITDFAKVEEIVKHYCPDWLFHFAAFTDVDKAEKDKHNNKNGKVWKINVDASKNIARLCKKYDIRLLYISTDYVFSGDKKSYSETDAPNPLSWYGYTKYQAEKIITEILDRYLTIRISYPYRGAWEGKQDFVTRIFNRLKSGQSVKAPADQIIVPTYINDIASAIKNLINQDLHGVFHVVGSGSYTPFEIADKICNKYGFSGQLIENTTSRDYFQNRAPRPLQAFLKNDRIRKYGIRMRSFDEGLSAINLF